MGNSLFTEAYGDIMSFDEMLDADLEPTADEKEALAKEKNERQLIPNHITEALELTQFESGDNILSAHPELLKLERYYLPNKLLVTTAGPQVHTIESFLDDTVFAANPINHVVALGNKINIEPDDYPYNQHDFLDYCVAEREVTFGHYQLSIKRNSGNVVSVNGEHHFADVITSDVTVKDLDNPKKEGVLHVTVLPVVDGYSFNLDNNDELKSVILKLYELSKKERMLIHCHGGYGRTGHLVYIMHLLDMADPLFKIRDSQTLARELDKQVAIIRNTNKAYLLNKDQYRASVINTYKLDQFQKQLGFDNTKIGFYTHAGAYHFSNFKSISTSKCDSESSRMLGTYQPERRI